MSNLLQCAVLISAAQTFLLSHSPSVKHAEWHGQYA